MNNPLWWSLRNKILTASNFGKICRMRNHTSTASTIDYMIYKRLERDCFNWGVVHEKFAKKSLERSTNKKIESCGLFIHKDLYFLGASPDGLIGKDGLVEIKCPYSAQDMTPEEGIEARKIRFWKKNMTINKNHHYYYQIQGQLEVTSRKYCLFACWTPKGIKIEKIERDPNFWKTEMEPQLIYFYFNCLLPELVDPRRARSMPLRDTKMSNRIEELKKVALLEEVRNCFQSPKTVRRRKQK